jgi:hypothetical protein
MPVLWQNLTLLTEHSREKEVRKIFILQIRSTLRRGPLDVDHVIGSRLSSDLILRHRNDFHRDSLINYDSFQQLPYRMSL